MINKWGCQSRLLVIEIPMAIRGMSIFKLLEYWSVGVLECWVQKRKKIFFFIPLLHHSNTPLLRIRLTSYLDKYCRLSFTNSRDLHSTDDFVTITGSEVHMHGIKEK